MGGKGRTVSIPCAPPSTAVPLQASLRAAPPPGPGSARRNSGNARVGGGAGRQRACRLLPGRSRCLRAGPVATLGGGWGVGGGGAASLLPRGAVAAVGKWSLGEEENPGRKAGTLLLAGPSPAGSVRAWAF